MDDEAYVGQRWEHIEEKVAPHKVTDRPSEWMRYVLINGRVEGTGKEKEHWAAAKSFTVECEEEIRQLDREIEILQAFGEQYTRGDLLEILTEEHANSYECEEESFDSWLERLPGYARDNCTIQRTITRLQSTLQSYSGA